MSDTQPIQPGGTIGMLGSGQLGRMFASAAHQLGFRVHVFSPDQDSPAGRVSEREFTADYDDEAALVEFARGVDVVTFEFENVALAAVDCIQQHVPVRPGREVLRVAQNRIVEKTTLRSFGLPVPEFTPIDEAQQIAQFMQRGGAAKPVVIKSAESGYDGKGQTVVQSLEDVTSGYQRIGEVPSIAEELVDFACELSVIGARSVTGEIECFGPVLNHHEDHILDVSVAPVESISAAVKAEAIEIGRAVLEQLEVIGVLCVELFLTTDDTLLINEIAPRPHNSGHLTIEAAVTSQFEQQARAVSGLPLGSMEQLHPAAMANLLGRHYLPDGQDWSGLLRTPNAHLHLYGKSQSQPKRKMGHITVTGRRAEEVVRDCRAALVAE